MTLLFQQHVTRTSFNKTNDNIKTKLYVHGEKINLFKTKKTHLFGVCIMIKQADSRAGTCREDKNVTKR